MRRLAAALSLAFAAAFLPNGYREYQPIEQVIVQPRPTGTGGIAPWRTPAAEVAAPRGTPGSSPGGTEGTPSPVPLPEGGRVSGVASTYGGSEYDGLFAVPFRSWRGHNVLVCYRERCVVRLVNDFGPDQRVWPDRVADLDGPTFTYLCECDWHVVGVLRGVQLTLLD